MSDLRRLSSRLEQNAFGVWTASGSEQTKLSYPEGGNDAYFAIEDASFWFQHRNACILAVLQRHPFDGLFLDVGGGNGAVSKALVAHGFDTVLLEPGPGVRNARARGIEHVVWSTLEQAAFETGAFGAAGLFDVIEHLEDDAAILGEVRRVVKPGGVVCVTVPAHAWLWSAEDDLAGHHRRYTASDLECVLDRSGFETEYVSYFFTALTAPILALRALPHRLGRAARPVEAGAGEHRQSAIARRAIDLVLGAERRRIAAAKTLPFGSSCLAIARRR